MGVGEESGTDTLHFLPEALHPELWRRIDHEARGIRLHQNRGSGTIIPGVIGKADGAIATDRWNPLGGASSEKGDFE